MSTPFSLTPTAVVSSSAVAVIGGGTANAALAAAGGAYVEFQNLSTTVGSTLIMELSDVTIPAGARVVYAQVFLSAKRVSAGTTMRLQLLQPVANAAGSFGYETVAVTGASFTPILGSQQALGYIQAIPVGQTRYWTQADLNSLRLLLDKPPDGALAHVDFAWVVGQYALQPVVNVTGPASPVTTTSRPVVTWTWTPDGSYTVQERYAIRVFSSAQYSAGGFSVETSPAVWEDSPYSSAQAAQVGVHLANGTYRAYVRANTSVAGGPHWSAWDYHQFTVNLTPPPVPSCSAVADSANGRIAITADTVSSTPSTDYYTIERTLDGGTTWETVRDADQVTPAPVTWDATVYDYEAPNGVAAGYRARAVSDDAGIEVASAPSSTSTATWSSSDWWLKVPGAPALNMIVVMAHGGIPQRVRRRPQGRHDVLGSPFPVVTSDVRHAVEAQMTVLTLDAGDRADLDVILDAGATCLLQSPLDAEWGSVYVELGDASEIRTGADEDEPLRLHQIALTQVEAPV